MPSSPEAISRHYLGYDPGGSEANAVAIISCRNEGKKCATATVESVGEALEWFAERLQGQPPIALGVDTFLFWEIGIGGWRGADRWLRDRYPDVQHSVLCSNSAAGSMAIQGMALAIEATRLWPGIKLIEVHPKVLYYSLTGQKYDWPSNMVRWLARNMTLPNRPSINSEHEWDALLCAWAAHQGTCGNWPSDLRRLSKHAVEPAGAVSYWWPE